MEKPNTNTDKKFRKKRHPHHPHQKSQRLNVIPQYIKNITINNACAREPYHPHILAPPPPGQRISRIIVKSPSFNPVMGQSHSREIGDENVLGGLISSLFTMNKQVEVSGAPQPDEVVKVIRKNIDWDTISYIDEEPETLEDLLSLADLAKTKYATNKTYNLDLASLEKLREPLLRLKKMVGLVEVKKKIVDIILFYLQRLDVKNCDMLHTIIDGAPGTGKTEIAQIYSEILVNLGILSKNTFRKAKKHDLIGGYLGHTAIKTSKLLEEVKGGVLFIDEIYSFGSSKGKDSKDIYSKEFVDLLMQFMSENKSDFVLVVAGYRDDIKNFFLSMNDGLERRFPIHLSITDYSPVEMYNIFEKKVVENFWQLKPCETDEKDGNSTSLCDFYNDFFTDNKDYFKFYGGDMENLFTKCKHAHSRNLIKNHSKKHRLIDKQDFLDGFALFKNNPEIEERKKTDKFMSYYM
jgi:SpoVK/Ycf46/Vps4 family AAA+-type ATPase